MKKYVKEIIDVIKKLRETPRGRGILFFSFYFVFFLGLAIFCRVVDTGSNTVTNPYENTNSNADIISVATKNGYNYVYYYNIQVDDVYYALSGVKNREHELFTFTFDNNIKDYYKDRDSYYVQENGSWVDAVSPNEDLIIIEKIDEIISNATYIARTEEIQSGKTVLRYDISSASISRIISQTDLAVEEIPNEISLIINNDRIDLVELNLNSYCRASNKCLDSMKITMNYSGFDSQKDIISPID